MKRIIVLFPKAEDGKNIRNLLVRHGYQVPFVCTTGAQALSAANSLGSGIVVCGYQYPDMMYEELKACLPPSVEMLLVVSKRVWGVCSGSGVMCVSMPLKAQELLNTLDMLASERYARPRKKSPPRKRRSEKEEAILQEAKAFLWEQNHMSEEEAHRYLQKCSMDSGTNLVEAAQMVLSMLNF